MGYGHSGEREVDTSSEEGGRNGEAANLDQELETMVNIGPRGMEIWQEQRTGVMENGSI